MRLHLLLFCVASASLGFGGVSAQSQVTPDGTLSTTITQSGNNFTITNGTAAGANLYHSFQQFSVPTGGIATFDLNATPTIRTIFSRVTGGSISNIDGIIRTANSANPVSLFLLNPAGILFGPNASLNISGSFVGTTASSIKFADGTEFSAVAPSATPLLTISVPIGLQFGQNPGTIQVQGSGHTLAVPLINVFPEAVAETDVPPGLSVNPGNTLGLLGGDVLISGGILKAPQGRLEIGAIGSNPVPNPTEVAIQPVPTGWTFDYDSISNFRNIQLTQKAFLSTTGDGGGSVQIQGAQVRVTDGSAIFANNTGTSNGGTVRLNSTDRIEVSSTSDNDSFASRILANVQPDATGQGSSIQLKTQNLLIDLAVINANTFGPGDSGGVQLQAPEVQITNSYIGAGSNPVDRDRYGGKGGDLTIQAKRVQVLSTRTDAYSLISTSTFGPGQGGNLTIQATDSVQITAQGGYGSFLTGTGGVGMGGKMLIETGTLLVQGYTGIDMATIGPGNSGSLTLKVNTLKLTEGGFIDISTYDAGNAGRATVNAQTVDISGSFNGRLPLGLDGGSVPSPSGIYVNTAPDTTGNGGQLTLTADRLLLRAGATITANTQGTGTGGSVSIRAQNVEVRDYFLDGLGTRAGIISSVDSANGGTGGDLTLVAQSLRVLDGGFISSATSGTGNAGNIFINAQAIEIAGTSPQEGVPSQIIASSTSEGMAGSIKLTADLLSLRDKAEIVVSGQGEGDAGNLWINANQLRLDTEAKLRAEASAGSQGNISLSAKLVLLRRNSAITTSASSSADGGNITIDAPIVAGFENSDIIANAVQGRGGNIQITTQGIFGLKFRPQLTSANDITASSQFGVTGTVQVSTIGVDPSTGLVPLPISLVDPTQQIAAGCAGVKDNQFVITGRGGVPINPLQDVKRDRTWVDLRDPTAFRSPTFPLPTSPTPKPLLEATTWRRNSNGGIELIAFNPSPTNLSVSPTCASAVLP